MDERDHARVRFDLVRAQFDYHVCSEGCGKRKHNVAIQDLHNRVLILWVEGSIEEIDLAPQVC